ncbi:hypothetical protein CALCODRAFT_1462 [Calocera cornea HHB12733]|uniref:Uncharacterized protein n=1 Tax=Calocera cornea HHB12733 TaxID=1353952 RepID=A0A165K7X6_9BASI|nr:hypothetical protein CALCODRAFT_1462 [Calocera cornea HHB12733]
MWQEWVWGDLQARRRRSRTRRGMRPSRADRRAQARLRLLTSSRRAMLRARGGDAREGWALTRRRANWCRLAGRAPSHAARLHTPTKGILPPPIPPLDEQPARQPSSLSSPSSSSPSPSPSPPAVPSPPHPRQHTTQRRHRLSRRTAPTPSATHSAAHFTRESAIARQTSSLPSPLAVPYSLLPGRHPPTASSLPSPSPHPRASMDMDLLQEETCLQGTSKGGLQRPNRPQSTFPLFIAPQRREAAPPDDNRHALLALPARARALRVPPPGVRAPAPAPRPAPAVQALLLQPQARALGLRPPRPRRPARPLARLVPPRRDARGDQHVGHVRLGEAPRAHAHPRARPGARHGGVCRGIARGHGRGNVYVVPSPTGT